MDHSFTSLAIQPIPSPSWRQKRTGDLLWTRDYLVPWLRRGVARQAADIEPAAKRPTPGPVIDDDMSYQGNS